MLHHILYDGAHELQPIRYLIMFEIFRQRGHVTSRQDGTRTENNHETSFSPCFSSTCNWWSRIRFWEGILFTFEFILRYFEGHFSILACTLWPKGKRTQSMLHSRPTIENKFNNWNLCFLSLPDYVFFPTIIS